MGGVGGRRDPALGDHSGDALADGGFRDAQASADGRDVGAFEVDDGRHEMKGAERDAVVVLKGRVSRRDEAMSLQALEMTLTDLASASDTAPITVQLAESRCTEPLVIKLREVLESHPGTTEVHLKLTMPGRATVMRLEDRLRVERSSALYGDLKALLGPHCLGT